jgi:hypothetical protein
MFSVTQVLEMSVQNLPRFTDEKLSDDKLKMVHVICKQSCTVQSYWHLFGHRKCILI